MARRPIFIPGGTSGPLYSAESIAFQWFPGMSASQKQKSMNSLHSSARARGFNDLLEVSTKSESELGRRLSAFRLEVDILNHKATIECIFQGSKVFERGGPFSHLFNVRPIEAKRYFKSVKMGKIVGFEINGNKFSNYPMHAFYDWLFIRSLHKHEAYLSEHILKYDAFTDIEFNPEKSVNTQARTMAIIASLIRRKMMSDAATDFNLYRKILMDAHLPHRPKSAGVG